MYTTDISGCFQSEDGDCYPQHQRGQVVIDSGFYSEAAMKAELKFDK